MGIQVEARAQGNEEMNKKNTGFVILVFFVCVVAAVSNSHFHNCEGKILLLLTFEGGG